MWLIGLIILMSGQTRADSEQQWVSCLMTICTDHFPPGHTVAVFLPSDEHYSTMTNIGHHLLKSINQADRWPLIVYRDTYTDNDRGEIVNSDDEYFGYIVLVNCARNIYEIKAKIKGSLVSFDQRHKNIRAWNTRSRFVVAVENECNTINPRKLSQEILSTLWFYKLINVVVVIKEEGRMENQLNVSTSVSDGRSPPLVLGLYTWFPYRSPNRCNRVEDVVLLDKWVMEGRGFLVQNSNLFPQKIGKTFNGCPLRGLAIEFKHMVNYDHPSPDTGSSAPVIKDGWEVSLFRLIADSLKMTTTYVPPPSSLHNLDITDGVVILELDEADILFGGLEFGGGGGRWGNETDTTVSYFMRRIRWYVPCSFKYPRWSSIYRIFSAQLWVCLLLSLAATSSIVSLIARFGRTYAKSPEGWSMTKSLTCVWAVILGATAPALPHKATVRVVFLAWLVFSLAVNTIFQSFLTTFLTGSGYEPPIHNIDQMLASKIRYGYNPHFDNIFIEADDENSQKILENRVLCPILIACFKWAKDYKNISLIIEELSVEEKYSTSSLIDENSKPLICPLDDGIVMTVNAVMMVRMGDPLLGRIDEIIQRVVEAGLFMQWKKSYFDKIEIESGTLHRYSLLDDYNSFTLEHMQPAFYMLLTGLCISTVILLVELAIHRVIQWRNSFFKKKRG